MMSSIGCGGIALAAALLLAVLAELVAVLLGLMAWTRRRAGMGLVANWIAIAGTPPLLFILLNAATEVTGTSGMDWEVFVSFTLALAALLMGIRALSEPQRRRWRMVVATVSAMWLFFVVFLGMGAYRGKQHDRQLREDLYRQHGTRL